MLTWLKANEAIWLIWQAIYYNMKTLHLVRHGKSSWDLPEISDIDRPLLPKGITTNYEYASIIKKKFQKPDLILSSPACRAVHTALIVARVFEIKASQLIINEKIYESNVSTILKIIEETSENIDSLVIVGHNPTFTELANLFFPITINNLATSGIVTLQFDSKNWAITNKTPIFTEINSPKKD